MGCIIAATCRTDLIPNTAQNIPAGYSQSFTRVEGRSDVKSPRLGPFATERAGESLELWRNLRMGRADGKEAHPRSSSVFAEV